MEPHNKVALVTGAGSGIGEGCARALLADGWRVVFAGRRLDALRAAIAEAGDPFGDIGERAVAIAADVGDPRSVAALFDRCASASAGSTCCSTTPASPAAARSKTCRSSRLAATVATNLTGPFLCTQAAFRLMQSQAPKGGRIINNGSISAHAPRPGSAAYTATKHAITGLTKAAALDGRRHDIAVGQIDIGNVATDMTERMVNGVPQADGSIRPEPRMATVGRHRRAADDGAAAARRQCAVHDGDGDEDAVCRQGLGEAALCVGCLLDVDVRERPSSQVVAGKDAGGQRAPLRLRLLHGPVGRVPSAARVSWPVAKLASFATLTALKQSRRV